MWLDPLPALLLALAAFASGLIGSVAGSGGNAILLPVVVLQMGVHAGIPALTIANLAANVSRVALNLRAIDARVVAWFVLGAVPCTLLATWLFTIAPPDALVRLVGVFMLAMLVWRRVGAAPPVFRKAAVFLPVGVVFGWLYGFVEGIGMLMAPFFLGYGLVRAAYIGTDALATVAIQVSKLTVFGSTDFLGGPVLLAGALMAPFTVLGTLVGRSVVARVSTRGFVVMVELTLLLSGLSLLLRG